MGIMKMAEEALIELESITCEEALARKDDGDLVFVDVRDIREVEKSNTIEGSHHAPRGLIEFWFDPDLRRRHRATHSTQWKSGRITDFARVGSCVYENAVSSRRFKRG